MKTFSQHRQQAGFTLTEGVVAAALALVLIAGVSPTARRNRSDADSSQKTNVAAMLTRVTRAKELYTVDKHLQKGDVVSVNQLVAAGHLSENEVRVQEQEGVRFIVGEVGTPVTYTFDHEVKQTTTATKSSMLSKTE